MAQRPEFSAPMRSDAITPPGVSGSNGAPPPEGTTAETAILKAFVGRNGIRAGWRLLIFAAITFVMFAIYGIVLRVLSHAHPGQAFESFAPGAVMAGEASMFGIILLASWIMTFIEGRTIGDYGLPIRKAFGKEFWQGAVVGFAAMTVLLVALRILGVFDFGSFALHGGTLVKYAALWGVAFLLVGFFEEYSMRGYALFTLTTGLGFWPAAILMSILFGAGHLGNPSEDWLGALAAGSAGFLFCLILRRTGDLWMAIGFHMSWDWAETFFYGVPDSGLSAPGHMLNPSFHGSKLLTGGSVGPEGSVFCFVVLALCWILFHFWLREAKYPDPAALAARPRRSAAQIQTTA